MLNMSKKTIYLCICLLLSTIAIFGQNESNDTRSGHTATINQVAFSPDGKFLASASSDHTIQIWEIGSGKIVLKIDAADSVYAVAFSPDGKFIAGGTGEKVKLWDAKTGKEIHSSEETSFGSLYVANSVAFSPDGKLLAAGNEGEDNEVVVWDVETGEESYRLTKAKSPITFNKSGTRLATASGDDLIKIWDVETSEKIRTIEGTGKTIALAFNPNGRTLVSVGENSGEREIMTWSVANGAQLEEFSPEFKLQGGCAFTPDGQSIVVVGHIEYDAVSIVYTGNTGRREIKFLDAETGAEQDNFVTELSDFGNAFALSTDGKKIAFSDSSGLNVFVLDWETKEQIAALKGHSISVEIVAFSRDGKTLTGIYKDGSVVHWDTASGQLKKYVLLKKESNWSGFEGMYLDANGSVLAKNNYNQVLFYDTADGTFFSSEEADECYHRNFAFSSDSKTLLAGTSKGLELFELSTGKILKKYALPVSLELSDAVMPVFGKDGKTIVGITKTGITFWNMTKGKILRTIKKDFGEDDIKNAVFSPDGKFLIISTGIYQTTILAVKVATGANLYKIEAYNQAFDISSDGKMLALHVSYDKLILTNLLSGKSLREIKDDELQTQSAIRFSHDNSILAVGGETGITLYKTATGEKIRSIK